MRQMRIAHCSRISVVCLLLVCAPVVMLAQINGSGSSVFNFLNLPVSSRLNALGGDNVALSDDDISMAFINPALLTAQTDKVLQLNYAYYVAGTMFGSVMYGHNYKDNYFGVGIHYLDYGKMTYADESGVRTGGTFTAKDMCINLMYARQLGPYFRVGATLKPLYSIYESYSSFALGADVGGHFQTADTLLHVGLALRNIGWQLKSFYSEINGQHTEMLPLNLELGVSYRLRHAPLRFSLTIHNMQRWYLGTESGVNGFDMAMRHTIWALDIVPKSDKFYVTLSYNHRRRQEMALSDAKSLAGFAWGFGVRIYKFRVGFAMSQFTKSNFTYQASLSMDINSFLK